MSDCRSERELGNSRFHLNCQYDVSGIDENRLTRRKFHQNEHTYTLSKS